MEETEGVISGKLVGNGGWFKKRRGYRVKSREEAP